MSCPNNCAGDCCRGLAPATPLTVYNRPGLPELAYRIGEHGSFLQSMLARLSSKEFPALAGFGSRTPDDPSVALLDGWATVADVLTFYQERLANEGFLRTATERRSILELARLIGYQPRPGVSATAYLAYEVDQNAIEPVLIPTGSKVQSLPGPGELPQTFETVEDFVAHKEWNAIPPRLQRPQSLARLYFGTDTDPGARVYLAGITTGLKVGDGLLIQVFDSEPRLFRATSVTVDNTAQHTLVRFSEWSGKPIQAPDEVRLRRALIEWESAASAATPASALAAQALAEWGAFLDWLYTAAIQTPRDADIATFLEEDVLIDELLVFHTQLLGLSGLPLSESMFEVGLKRLIVEIAKFPGVIEEYTQLNNGGLVGVEILALAARLAALQPSGEDTGDDQRLAARIEAVLDRLNTGRSVPPRNSESLERDPAALLDRNSDAGVRAVKSLSPLVRDQLEAAIKGLSVTGPIPIRVWSVQPRMLLFGSSAPPKITSVSQSGVVNTEEWTDVDIAGAESPAHLDLEIPTDKAREGQWVVVDYSNVNPYAIGAITLPKLFEQTMVVRAGRVSPKLARAAYATTGQTTRIPLLDAQGKNVMPWYRYQPESDKKPAAAFELIRNTAVYLQGDELTLANEPVLEDICGTEEWIETDALYSGLEPGQWVAVSGERADVPGTAGVTGSELAMIAAVKHYLEPNSLLQIRGKGFGALSKLLSSFEPGETLHTYFKLAAPLAYCYRRATVRFNANVIKASHGDTRTEILGAGDAAQRFQQFVLRQPPLTYIPANEPDGIESTLRVYVNGVEWHESPALTAMGPTDRAFLTQTNDDGTTTVIFGDGQMGSRVPTGLENIQATYRSGIGKAGNVRAGQINQLLSRPLGVKGVNNPLEASGGADAETRDQARANAPLAVRSLDRLVGIRDYADFARTFAGIGKAASARLAAGGVERVYVTIAGAEDVPVPASSDLYQNLVAALRTYGDPAIGIAVQTRELLALTMLARIRIFEDYRWEDVVATVRTALLDEYSFERRELGQSVMLSAIVATIQRTPGVRYVDIEALGAVSQLRADGGLRSPQEFADLARQIMLAGGRPPSVVSVRGIRRENGVVMPAQLAFLVPDMADLLVLNRIEDGK